MEARPGTCPGAGGGVVAAEEPPANGPSRRSVATATTAAPRRTTTPRPCARWGCVRGIRNAREDVIVPPPSSPARRRRSGDARHGNGYVLATAAGPETGGPAALSAGLRPGPRMGGVEMGAGARSLRSTESLVVTLGGYPSGHQASAEDCGEPAPSGTGRVRKLQGEVRHEVVAGGQRV